VTDSALPWLERISHCGTDQLLDGSRSATDSRPARGCLSARPRIILLQTQQNASSKQARLDLAPRLPYEMRHTKYSAEALKTSRDKIQFGFHSKEP
jgi:hypothetical protein